MHHELQPVADAKDGLVHFEEPSITGWRPMMVDARRSTRENKPSYARVLHRRSREIVPREFRVNAALPNAPTNQMGVLGPEVQHENAVGTGGQSHWPPPRVGILAYRAVKALSRENQARFG
jgi:hypothetical protein